MKSRTTLILVLLAAGAAAFVLLDYYKGTPTEDAQTKRKRILDFRAKDVTRIELVRTNETIVLEKSGDQWDIKQPMAVRASYTAVSSILDELEFAERDRMLTEKELDGTSLDDFGLFAPRLRVVLHGAKEPVTLLIGGETPTRDALYVQLQGKKPIFVTRKSIRDRVDRNFDDLRDRAVLDFSIAAVTRLEMKNAERVVELTKLPAAGGEGARWALSRPLSARADQRKVGDLLAELNGLRVLDFVSENPKDVHTYQLREPEREVTVWTGDNAHVLLVGRPLTNDASKVYAKLKDTDSIFTVPVSAVERVTIQANDLRDARILTVSEADVGEVELLRGSDRLVMVRDTSDSGGWKITTPVSVAAEEPLVRQMLTQLSGLNATEFSADVATDLEKYGLAVPTVTATLRSNETNLVVQLLVGSLNESGRLRYVKRGDEPFIYGVEPNIVDWLPATVLDFRTRTLSDLTADQVTKIVLQKRTGTTTLERDADGKWRMVEPAHGALDNDALQRLLEAFTQFRAKQFVRQGDDNLGEFGLDDPELTITAQAGAAVYTMILGKPREAQETFAYWSQPSVVFTVWAAQTSALTKDIVLPAVHAGDAAQPTVEVATPPVAGPPPSDPKNDQ